MIKIQKLESMQTNSCNSSFTLGKLHKVSQRPIDKLIIIHISTCNHFGILKLYTMYDYFSDSRVTVNSEEPIDSRLHQEVLVFILAYSQYSFIHLAFTLRKQQTCSSVRR